MVASGVSDSVLAVQAAAVDTLRKNASCFGVSLCLSRACLGKPIGFSIKRKRCVFFAHRGLAAEDVLLHSVDAGAAWGAACHHAGSGRAADLQGDSDVGASGQGYVSARYGHQPLALALALSLALALALAAAPGCQSKHGETRRRCPHETWPRGVV